MRHSQYVSQQPDLSRPRSVYFVLYLRSIPQGQGIFATVHAICVGLEVQLHPFITLGLDPDGQVFQKKKKLGATSKF
jgi:hypothetical protein